jgi:hypothetical protein
MESKKDVFTVTKFLPPNLSKTHFLDKFNNFFRI